MSRSFSTACIGWVVFLGGICLITEGSAQDEVDAPTGGQQVVARTPRAFPASMTLGKTTLHAGPAERPAREFPAPADLPRAYAHLDVEVRFTNPDPNQPIEIDPLADSQVWLLDAQQDAASGANASSNRMFRLTSLNRNEPVTLEPGESRTVLAQFELAFIPGNGFLSSPKKRSYFVGLQMGNYLAIRRFEYDPGVAVEGLMKSQ